MPNLPYPELAYRGNESHPESQHDSNLPVYEGNGPPKYDFSANVPISSTTGQQQPAAVPAPSENQEMQQMGAQRVFTPATTPSVANQVPLFPVPEEPESQLQTVSLDDPWQDRAREQYT